jgi:hypothetical protein
MQLDYQFGVDVRPVAGVPPEQRRTFQGYRRADGSVGTRNTLVLITTVNCAAHTTRQIAPVRSKGRHHCQLATLRSEDRWLLAEATTDSIDAVTTKVADLAAPRDLMSVASDLRQSAFMGGASQTDAACSRAF